MLVVSPTILQKIRGYTFYYIFQGVDDGSAFSHDLAKKYEKLSPFFPV